MDVALVPKMLVTVLAAAAGQAARFLTSAIKPKGRGVDGDFVSDMAVLHREEPSTLVAGRF